MPLLPGKENIGRNITELREHGTRPRSERQILAIALSNADRHPHRALGGGIGHLSGGLGVHMPSVAAPKAQLVSPSQGGPWWTRAAAHEMTAGGMGGHPHFEVGGEPMAMASPWWERSEARQINDVPFHSGLIGGSGAGRTDQLPLAVGSDSHVLSADVVSGVGQNHTLAGARILDAALKTAPYGVPLPHAVHGHGPPPAPHPFADTPQPGMASMEHIASGGALHRKTSILAASGEYVCAPEDVEALGQRGLKQGLGRKNETAMDLGHRLLDEMVARVRKFNIAWLRSAPPPKK